MLWQKITCLLVINNFHRISPRKIMECLMSIANIPHLLKTLIKNRNLTNILPNLQLINSKPIILEILEILAPKLRSMGHMEMFLPINPNLILERILQVLEDQMPIGLSIITKIMMIMEDILITLFQIINNKGVSKRLIDKIKLILSNMIHQNFALVEWDVEENLIPIA